MHRAAAAILVTAAFPATASAQCPTRADLATGVTLTRAEPFFESRFIAASGDLSERRTVGKGADTLETVARYLHGLVSSAQEDARGRFQMAVFADLAPLDRLPEVGQWQSEVNAAWNGAFVGEGTITLIYVETVPWEIGDCAYDVWYVQETVEIDTLQPAFNDRYYAPALGLPLANVVVTREGEPVSNVVYDQVRAE